MIELSSDPYSLKKNPDRVIRREHVFRSYLRSCGIYSVSEPKLKRCYSTPMTSAVKHKTLLSLTLTKMCVGMNLLSS